MIELTLPWPPTVNTYWRNFNGRTILSAKGREYRKAVADQVLIQRGAKHYDFALKVTIKAYRPDRRRRDLDNLLKAVLDGSPYRGQCRCIAVLALCGEHLRVLAHHRQSKVVP